MDQVLNRDKYPYRTPYYGGVVCEDSAAAGDSRRRVEELMHINTQWAADYHDLQMTLTQCKADSDMARRENYSLREEAMALRDEVSMLKLKLEEAVRQPSRLGGGGHQDQEIGLLKQQLKAYQEDFDAERREKERLMGEKQNERLRLQAEITSLQLQLDRCRTELSHYSSEATRLAHQLKIRNQVEQEQYRRSPEDLGIVPRGLNGAVHAPKDTRLPGDLRDLRDLREGREEKHPMNREGTTNPPPSASSHKSPSPYHSPLLSQNKKQPVSDPRVEADSSKVIHPDHGSPAPPPVSGKYPVQSVASKGSPVPPPASGNSPVQSVDGRGSPVPSIASAGSPVPPLANKGKQVCPRCSRRFTKKSELNEHTAKCFQY